MWRFPPSTLRFYSITPWSCSAPGSLWEMLDLNPGPLPQKSGALPNEPPYLQMRLILYRSGTVRGRGTKEQLITIHPGLRQILGCIFESGGGGQPVSGTRTATLWRRGLFAAAGRRFLFPSRGIRGGCCSCWISCRSYSCRRCGCGIRLADWVSPGDVFVQSVVVDSHAGQQLVGLVRLDEDVSGLAIASLLGPVRWGGRFSIRLAATERGILLAAGCGWPGKE